MKQPGGAAFLICFGQAGGDGPGLAKAWLTSFGPSAGAFLVHSLTGREQNMLWFFALLTKCPNLVWYLGPGLPQPPQ